MVKLTVVAVVLGMAFPGGPVLADQAGAIAAECKLLEAAHRSTAKAQGSAPTAILVGCPGHEGLVDDTTRKQDRQRFKAAMSTPVPEGAKAQGKMGKILFQRMIARGVPPEVAVSLAGGKAFTAAVAAAQ